MQQETQRPFVGASEQSGEGVQEGRGEGRNGRLLLSALSSPDITSNFYFPDLIGSIPYSFVELNRLLPKEDGQQASF